MFKILTRFLNLDQSLLQQMLLYFIQNWLKNLYLLFEVHNLKRFACFDKLFFVLQKIFRSTLTLRVPKGIIGGLL